MIEEEVYSDPDHSSVYTSEDSFESEKGMQHDFAVKNPLRALTEASGNFERQSKASSCFKSPSKLLKGLGEKLGPRDTPPFEQDGERQRSDGQDSGSRSPKG